MSSARTSWRLFASLGLALGLACQLAAGAEPPPAPPAASAPATTPAAAATAGEAPAPASGAAPAVAPAAGASAGTGAGARYQHPGAGRADPGPQAVGRRPEPGLVRARRGAAVSRQYAGGGVRIDGRRGVLRARLGDAARSTTARSAITCTRRARWPRWSRAACSACTSAISRPEPHELVALFSGKGPNDRDYRRGASTKFEKGVGAKYLELKISDRVRSQQPEFEIKDWE